MIPFPSLDRSLSIGSVIRVRTQKCTHKLRTRKEVRTIDIQKVQEELDERAFAHNPTPITVTNFTRSSETPAEFRRRSKELKKATKAGTKMGIQTARELKKLRKQKAVQNSE